MVAGGKWITGIEPSRPFTQAAQAALRERFKALRQALRDAGRTPNVEHVHQVRVAARRAVAAVRISESLLPLDERQAVLKQLKKIRRSADEARNLDVLALRIATASKKNFQGDEAVQQEIARRREPALQAIQRRLRKLKRRDFRGQAKRLRKLLRWNHDEPEPTFAEAAALCLRPLVDDFLASVDQVRESPGSRFEALHQMRIGGKAIRYAIEIFAEARPDLKELYEPISRMQDRLGAVNDFATAAATFDRWSEETESGWLTQHFRRLAADERAQLAHAQRDAEAWLAGAEFETICDSLRDAARIGLQAMPCAHVDLDGHAHPDESRTEEACAPRPSEESDARPTRRAN